MFSGHEKGDGGVHVGVGGGIGGAVI